MTIAGIVGLVAAVEAIICAAFTVDRGSDLSCIVGSLAIEIAVDACTPLNFATLILGHGLCKQLPVQFFIFFTEDP